jgi:uncharacterized membrane protein
MKRLFRSIRTHILIGGVLVTPVAVTLWVILLLVNLLSSSKISTWLATPVIRRLPGGDIVFVQAAVSLFIVLALLFLVGLLFRNFLGRRAYRVLDRMMEKTPFINKVYTFVRTVSESIVAQKETMFKEVVLIQYPNPGSYAIAFVSAPVPPSIQAKLAQPAEPHVHVFMPTTPNPTTGFLLLIPRKDIIPLSMATSDAMRMIVSAGASGPGEIPVGSTVPSLLEKLESMVESHRLSSRRPSPELGPSHNLDDFSDPE